MSASTTTSQQSQLEPPGHHHTIKIRERACAVVRAEGMLMHIKYTVSGHHACSQLPCVTEHMICVHGMNQRVHHRTAYEDLLSATCCSTRGSRGQQPAWTAALCLVSRWNHGASTTSWWSCGCQGRLWPAGGSSRNNSQNISKPHSAVHDRSNQNLSPNSCIHTR